MNLDKIEELFRNEENGSLKHICTYLKFDNNDQRDSISYMLSKFSNKRIYSIEKEDNKLIVHSNTYLEECRDYIDFCEVYCNLIFNDFELMIDCARRYKDKAIKLEITYFERNTFGLLLLVFRLDEDIHLS